MMDNTDKKLISILRRDGRESLSNIGKQLGMSHVAVSKRLDKLRNKGLVHIGSAVSGEAVNAKIVFLALETENMDVAHRITETYKDCPRLLMLAPVTGRYNLFAIIVAEDTVSLESILGTCSMRVEEGVRRSETWFGNAPLVPEFLPIDLAPKQTGRAKAPCGFNCAECRRYQQDKCVACPGTSLYKGSLWYTPETPKTKRSRRRKS